MCVLTLLPGLGCFPGVILLLFVKESLSKGWAVSHLSFSNNADNGKPLQCLNRELHLDLIVEQSLVFYCIDRLDYQPVCFQDFSGLHIFQNPTIK